MKIKKTAAEPSNEYPYFSTNRYYSGWSTIWPQLRPQHFTPFVKWDARKIPHIYLYLKTPFYRLKNNGEWNPKADLTISKRSWKRLVRKLPNVQLLPKISLSSWRCEMFSSTEMGFRMSKNWENRYVQRWQSAFETFKTFLKIGTNAEVRCGLEK